MKFFRENSYDIVKLYINQIGISIFSLFLYFAVGGLELEGGLKLLADALISAFSMIFYFVLIYLAAWDFGAKDKVRVDSGRTAAIPKKGLFMSLTANLPNFVLSFLCIVFLAASLLAGSEGLYAVFAVFSFILRITTAMYNGLLQVVFQGVRVAAGDKVFLLWQSVGFLVIPVLAVGITQLGYSLGCRERRIRQLFSRRG